MSRHPGAANVSAHAASVLQRQASHAVWHDGTGQVCIVWVARNLATEHAGGNSVRAPSPPAPGSPMGSPIVVGVACGIGAAVFWAAGLVAARHGISAGFSPTDITLHRFVWAGLVCLPLIARKGLADFGGVGWTKALALTLVGGPPLALMSYAGFRYVPLAHGGVIQPSCAALGGLVLATIVLKEKLPAQRAIG